MAKRPLGVTIICLIGWLGALLSVIGGLSTIWFFGLGTISLILGVVTAIVLYWLWQMKKQGWMWTMVLEGILLLVALVQMDAVGVIVAGIVLVYLWMNKKLFK
jgi:hypothetical protein